MPKRKKNILVHRSVVWVVGASRGIGREIAKQFAWTGCEVCLTARSKRDLSSAKREIADMGGRAHSYPCDITNSHMVLATARRIHHDVGDVDVLVSVAGVTVFKPFLKTSLQEFRDVLSTNLVGHLNCIQAVLPSMAKRRSGWIINISSNAAMKTFEASAAYTASKAGLLGAMRVLREEMKSSGIKVVNVLPGPTATEMWSISDRRRHAKRMMHAKSVAEAVLAIYQMPPDTVVDEMVIRPLQGDID